MCPPPPAPEMTIPQFLIGYLLGLILFAALNYVIVG
jgi:hypothetical protein